eukprot:gene6830-10995_t
MTTEAGILTATSSSASTGLNFSLFKVGPLMQVLAGATFASMALTATTLTVIVVATTSSFAAPVLKPDTYITTKTNLLKMDVLLNDVDPKGGVLKISKVTQPRYGSVVIDAGNFLLYTPQNMGKRGHHYEGIVTFTYSVQNEKLESTTNVTVDVRNRLPEPVALVYVVPMNTENYVASVLSDKDKQGKQATDVDEDELSIATITRQPPNGVLKVSADGKTVIYTPNKGFSNSQSSSNADVAQTLPDSGSYTVTDGSGSTTTDVGFVVVNEPPVANPDLLHDSPTNVVLDIYPLVNDVDPNGDNLTIIHIEPSLGTPVLSADGKSVKYYPYAPEYPFDYFFYTITDGEATSQSYVSIAMVNKPPVAGTIDVEISKNSNDNVLNILYSDPDPFNTLTVSISTPPTLGTYSLTSQSEQITTRYLEGFDKDITYTKNTYTLTYTPQKGKLYTDVIKYIVSDGDKSVEGTVNINVVNTRPVAVNDNSASQKNNKKIISLVINDNDANGDALKIKSIGACDKGGSVAVISDSDVEYTPPTDFAGVDSFMYTITDIQEDMTKALTSDAQVVVAVSNTAPEANPDTFTAQRGSSNQLDVLANDSDVNQDTLEIASVDSVSTSGVSLSIVNNKVQYTALTGAAYVDTFKYKCTDKDLVSNEVTVTVNVVNTAPVAVDDSVTMKWNTQKTIDVLSNDKDINPGDLAILEVSSVSTATNGIVSIDANKKTVTYKPNTGFVGTDSFTYTITDGIEGSNTATVNVDVQNTAPVAQADAYTLHFGATAVFDVLSNDSDADSDAISIKSVTTPTKGVAVIEGGKIKYTATADLGVQTFQYTITDEDKDATALVSVTVTNTAPVAVADVASVHWKSVDGVQINVLDNDSDADLDAISVTTFTQPSKGSVTKVGNVLTYKPDGSSGSFSFHYTITDGASEATGTVTVTVTNTDKPSASPVSHTIHWRQTPTVTQVTQTSTTGDGDSITVVLTNPQNGVVTKQTDATSGAVSLSYAQNQPYKGADSFNYTVSDGLDTATATVSFTITNAAPVAKSYSLYLHASNAASGLVIDAAADATDANAADVPHLTIKAVTVSPTQGTAVIQNNGNEIKYVPTNGYVGADSFKYTVTDGLDDSLEATVNVDNLAPTLSFKSYSKHWKASQTTGNVLFVTENITDAVDKKTLHLTKDVTVPPQSGSVSFEAAEVVDDIARVYKINYKSNVGFVGTDTFKLKMSNVAGDNKPELTVEVKVTNQAPTANDATATIHWSANSVELSILTGASDADAEDSVSYESHTSPTCGDVSQNAGKLTFANRNPAVLGDCTFNFVVTDGLAKVTKQAIVSVTNTAPVAQAKSFTIQWTEHKTGFAMNLLTGATDADGDIVSLQSVSALSDSTAGTISKTANGASISAATPSSFVNKAVTFSYTVFDGASTDTKLVTVTVQNTAPVANDDTYSFTGTQPQSTFELDVLSNDVDTDPLTIKSFSYTGTGSVSISNNKLAYKPKDGFVGEETISYVATDSMSDSNTGIVKVTISNSAPNAVADSATVQWNKQVQILPITNDNDVENNTPLTLASISQQPTSGSITVAGNEVTYTPLSSITYTSTSGDKRIAVDTFKYKVKDSYGLSSEGTVTVTVGNAPPTATDKSHTFAKTAANVAQVIDVIGTTTTDADGDAITISAISYTTGNGAAVTIVNNKINYKPASTFRGNDEVTFVLSDGQLTASAKLSITVTNQKPTCGPITKTVDKIQSYVWDLKTLGSASDPNGDDITIQLDATNVADKAEVSIQSQTEVKFTSKSQRSGVYVFKYLCFDGLLASDPQTVTVTINNKAPIAVNDVYNAFKVNDASHSIAVLENDSDPDAGDSVSLVSVSLTDGTVGTVSVEANKVKFVPSNSFAGTTTATYTIKDSDQDNSKTATGTLSVTVIEALPVVNDDLIKVNWNTPAVISTESLLANDEAPAGMSLRFHSLVDCNTLDNDIYCLFDKKPVLNSPSAGYITLNYKQNSCRENKFKYCVDTDKLPGATVCGTVTVKYINCECRGQVDVVFALDSSGSMSNNDWATQVEFSKNISKAITKNMNHPNDIKIGVVQFSTTSKTKIGLANYNAVLNNKLNGLKNDHMRGWTGTLLGLNDAVKVHDTNGGRKGIPKVIVVMSDGVANRPCNCNKCDYIGHHPCKNCVSCSDNYGVWCQPCASPVARATEINSWRKAAGQDARWKVIAMGLGKDLHNYNDLGWNILKGMNYDADQTLLVKFDNLNKAVEAIKAVQLVVDEVCSISE